MEIYQPEEDSYLMSEALALEIPKFLKNHQDLKFLEMGFGSGINLKTAEEAGVKKENILGADINDGAVSHCKKLGFNCIKSDLFKEFKGGVSVRGNLVPLKFNIIAFNPPYLPLDRREPGYSRVNTTGGKKGNEVIIKFLKQAKEHLAESRKIFLITSSFTGEIDFKRFGYNARPLFVKDLFFEKLFLWELS